MPRWLPTGLLLFALFGLATPAVPQIPAGVFTPTRTPVGPDGTRPACDLPMNLHMRNTGGIGPKGPGTGAGLCVFTSVEVAARWQNVRAMDGFQKWMTTRPGGGYPQKLAEMIRQFCAEKGVAVPHYVQHTGGDMGFLDLAIKTRRMVGITYAGKDDYYTGPIAHMVDLAHLDAKRACVIDNNRPEVSVWMDRADLEPRWKAMSGGWAFVWLAPPPPVAPVSFGQCPNGRCPLVPVVPQPVIPNTTPAPLGTPPSPDHYWGRFPDGQWGWRLRDRKGDETNHGIDEKEIDARPRYWIDGRECTRGEALAAVASDGLVDDSGKYFLSLVAGDEHAARAALSDPRVAPLAAKCLVQVYAPDSWVAKSRLSAAVSVHEPAAKGGGLVATADGFSPDELLALLTKILGPLLPPVPPVPAPSPPILPGPGPSPAPVPAPPTPTPAPAPCPCPQPCPCPGPCPTPPPPEPTPTGPQPSAWVSLMAMLAALFGKRREG